MYKEVDCLEHASLERLVLALCFAAFVGIPTARPFVAAVRKEHGVEHREQHPVEDLLPKLGVESVAMILEDIKQYLQSGDAHDFPAIECQLAEAGQKREPKVQMQLTVVPRRLY